MNAGEPFSGGAIRKIEVEGPAGRRRLGDLLRGPTLLVFLREFG
jgi:hypothetical protein